MPWQWNAWWPEWLRVQVCQSICNTLWSWILWHVFLNRLCERFMFWLLLVIFGIGDWTKSMIRDNNPTQFYCCSCSHLHNMHTTPAKNFIFFQAVIYELHKIAWCTHLAAESFMLSCLNIYVSHSTNLNSLRHLKREARFYKHADRWNINENQMLSLILFIWYAMSASHI